MNPSQVFETRIAEIGKAKHAASQERDRLLYAVQVKGETKLQKQLDTTRSECDRLSRELEEQSRLIPLAKAEEEKERRRLIAEKCAAAMRGAQSHARDGVASGARIDDLVQQLAAELVEFKECRAAAVNAVQKTKEGAQRWEVADAFLDARAAHGLLLSLGVHDLLRPGSEQLFSRTLNELRSNGSQPLGLMAERLLDAIEVEAERYGVGDAA